MDQNTLLRHFWTSVTKVFSARTIHLINSKYLSSMTTLIKKATFKIYDVKFYLLDTNLILKHIVSDA